MQQTTVQNFITELPRSDFMGYVDERFQNLQKKVDDFVDKYKELNDIFNSSIGGARSSSSSSSSSSSEHSGRLGPM